MSTLVSGFVVAITIAVAAVPAPEQVRGLVPARVADQATDEGSPFSFTLVADTFADIDTADSLTLSASLADGSALPTWLSFDPATLTFSGTPDNGDVGSISLRVTATDEGEGRARHAHVENDEPQPQVVLALGLRITNCAPCRLSV